MCGDMRIRVRYEAASARAPSNARNAPWPAGRRCRSWNLATRSPRPATRAAAACASRPSAAPHVHSAPRSGLHRVYVGRARRTVGRATAQRGLQDVAHVLPGSLAIRGVSVRRRLEPWPGRGMVTTAAAAPSRPQPARTCTRARQRCSRGRDGGAAGSLIAPSSSRAGTRSRDLR